MMDGSERQSHGEDHVVYGRVEFSRRDLDACADSESDAAVQRNSPDNQSGCQEHLLVASVLSVLKKRGIHFDLDRKSTRLNSSHTVISYAVFCLKKKKKKINYENH